MRTKGIFITIVIAFMGIGTTFGQAKTEMFKVYGNWCVCESRIEKAAKSDDGVTPPIMVAQNNLR